MLYSSANVNKISLTVVVHKVLGGSELRQFTVGRQLEVAVQIIPTINIPTNEIVVVVR